LWQHGHLEWNRGYRDESSFEVPAGLLQGLMCRQWLEQKDRPGGLFAL
jgi:hypothetical protein